MEKPLSHALFLSFLSFVLSFNTEAKPFIFEYQVSRIFDAEKTEAEMEKVYFDLMKWLRLPLENECQIKIKFMRLPQLSARTQHSFSKCENEIRIDREKIEQVQLRSELVHELIHVFRNQIQPNETMWLHEGLAQLVEMEFVGIWPEKKQKFFYQSPFVFLSTEENDFAYEGPGFAPAYFFLKYLYNRYGGSALIRELVKSPFAGWANIEQSLQNLKEQGIISMPDSMLKRDAIWNYFAFAILYNDASLANYGVFLLDYKFTGLVRKPYGSIPLWGENATTATNNRSYDWSILFQKTPRGNLIKIKNQKSISEYFSGLSQANRLWIQGPN